MATDTDNTAAAAREALQARILVELMGNALAKELVLKGGLAMRLAHGSERYTKDIDLDADPAFPMQRIQGIVRRSIAGAISSGLIDNAVVTNPKQTETTLRWKISGFYPGSTDPLHLTVEVSRRTPLVPSGVVEVPVPGFNSRTTIRAMSSRALAVSKVFALPRSIAPRCAISLTWMCSSAQTLRIRVKRSRRYPMLKHASRPHGRSSGARSR